MLLHACEDLLYIAAMLWLEGLSLPPSEMPSLRVCTRVRKRTSVNGCIISIADNAAHVLQLFLWSCIKREH